MSTMPPSAGPAAPPGAAAAAASAPAVIETKALTKVYPGQVTALDGLTVAVAPGITGLVGANGAGKSTLIKILLGLLPPTRGQARVLGHDCQTSGQTIRTLLGYMPEHDCLPPDVTATEFVTHLGRMSGLPPTVAKERAAESLRHVGLHEERYRLIGTYSTGMKQRVKLAQALVGDPRLLLLDEPTNGLDPAGRTAMLELIGRIGTEFGISIVVASHLLGEIERICRPPRHDEIASAPAGRRGDHLSQASHVLVVEVEKAWPSWAVGSPPRGLAPRRGHSRSARPGTQRSTPATSFHDAIADLALPLRRLEQLAAPPGSRNCSRTAEQASSTCLGTTAAGDVHGLGSHRYNGPRLSRARDRQSPDLRHSFRSWQRHQPGREGQDHPPDPRRHRHLPATFMNTSQSPRTAQGDPLRRVRANPVQVTIVVVFPGPAQAPKLVYRGLRDHVLLPPVSLQARSSAPTPRWPECLALTKKHSCC